MIRELRTFDSADPAGIRAKVLDICRRAAAADGGLFYNIVELDGVRRATQIQSIGFPDPEEVRRIVGALPHETMAMIDLTNPDPNTTVFWSVRRLVPSAAFESSALYRRGWLPLGIEDNLGTLVWNGRVLVGTVSLLRFSRSAYGEADTRRMTPLLGPTRAAMTAAHCLERQGLPDEPSYLLLRQDGSIEYGSRLADAWLARTGFRRDVSAFARSFARGEPILPSRALGLSEARIVRIATQDGERYLVSLRRATELQSGPEFVLSPQQWTIAEFAAAGATVPEIATTLGRHRTTIKTHLRTIYRRLGVSSRVELASAVSSSRQKRKC